jgi:hypothetical protein
MRNPKMAARVPSWMRLIQYSILVEPGPEKAWQTLKSSWYCVVGVNLNECPRAVVTETYHLLVDPLQPGNKLVVKLAGGMLATGSLKHHGGNEPKPSWSKRGAQKVNKG